MKVRIIDVDSQMVNHAILKISGWHKALGDDVKFYSPVEDYLTTDLAYVSKIFRFTNDYSYLPDCKIIKGGSGYDILTTLSTEIENADPDYSIYPNCDYSIVFFSRGCVNNCPFCIVREKEGYIQPVVPIKLNPNGKRIEVFDNNFFANPRWEDACSQLIEWNQPVNFHGIDARSLTEQNALYLNKIKRFKQIHIAWDNPKINIIPKLREIITWIKPYKLMCYVLIGFWSTKEEDLYRVLELKNLGIDPFVMPFDKSNPYQKAFARWVNHKAVFKTVKWEDYRSNNKGVAI
jgi:hypothetical protein